MTAALAGSRRGLTVNPKAILSNTRICLKLPCDWLMTTVTGFRFPLRGEGGVDVLVQLTRRVVADIEQGDGRGVEGGGIPAAPISAAKPVVVPVMPRI